MGFKYICIEIALLYFGFLFTEFLITKREWNCALTRRAIYSSVIIIEEKSDIPALLHGRNSGTLNCENVSDIIL